MTDLDTEIVAELKTLNSELSTVGRSLRDQGNVLGEVASSLTLVLERQKAAPINGPGGRVSLGNLLTMLGCLAVVGWILFQGLETTQSDHSKSIGHPTLATRVKGLEEIIGGEEERNTKIEIRLTKLEESIDKWVSKHDREVILINTSQASGIEQNHESNCVLWAKLFVGIPCPSLVTQPRVVP